eukprot:NODE_5689_length_1743_cov_8.019183.p1 GENE.NODE_5689_length_1743_cov_8.019183~~NODE_5689_length_1743_cov_8.019183.p1  ORF type:complete len:494 (-),score=122.59 NODE_5689_length_1743_cov_8.019183:260-1549(-)
MTRKIYGLSIHVGHSGSFMFFEPYELYLWLVSASVVLALPSAVIRVLLLHFLGRLSHIYARIIREPFSISSELAITPILLIIARAMYKLAEDGGQGISDDHILELIADATTGCAAINVDELHRMATVMRNSMHLHDAMNEGHAKFRKLLPSCVGVKREQVLDKCAADTIGAECFISCYMDAARLTFPDLIKVFDVDREPSCMEWLFMPTALADHTFLTSETKRTDEFIDSGGGDPAHVAAEVKVAEAMRRPGSMDSAWEDLAALGQHLREEAAAHPAILLPNEPSSALVLDLQQQVADLRVCLEAIVRPLQDVIRNLQCRLELPEQQEPMPSESLSAVHGAAGPTHERSANELDLGMRTSGAERREFETAKMTGCIDAAVSDASRVKRFLSEHASSKASPSDVRPPISLHDQNNADGSDEQLDSGVRSV